MNKLTTWLPISISVIVILINMSITYGQTASEIDTLRNTTTKIELQLEKVEENSEIKLELIKEKVTDSKIELAKMKVMLQQILKMMEK